MVTAVEVVSKIDDLTIERIDIEKLEKKFEKDNKYFLGVGVFKRAGASLKVELKGTLTTDGINSKEFKDRQGKKVTNYSIGIAFDDEAEILAIEKICELISDECPGYHVESPIKDDKLYVKLKYTRNKFNFASNIEITPKKHEGDLSRGQQINLYGELKVWVNLKDKKAGVSFDLEKLEAHLDQ